MAPTPPPPSFLHKGQRLTDHLNVDLEVVDVKAGGFGFVAIGPDQRSGGAIVVLKTYHPERATAAPTCVPSSSARPSSGSASGPTPMSCGPLVW